MFPSLRHSLIDYINYASGYSSEDNFLKISEQTKKYTNESGLSISSLFHEFMVML